MFGATLDDEENLVTCGRLLRGSAIGPVCMAFSAEGELQWQAKLPQPGFGNDAARRVVIDSVGRIAVAGEAFDSDRGWQAMVWKLSPQGGLLWTRQYGEPTSTSTDLASALLLNDAEMLIVGGRAGDASWIAKLSPSFGDEASSVLFPAGRGRRRLRHKMMREPVPLELLPGDLGRG